MAKLNKLKINELSHKVADVAQSGLDRASRLAEIAKLKASNHTEEAAMKRAYIEIGKLYYAEKGEAPEGAYVALCSRISKSRDMISHNLEQIAQLKSVDDLADDLADDLTEEDFDDDIQFSEDDFQDEAGEEAEAPAEEPVPEASDAEEPAQEAPAEEAPIPDEE